MAYVICSCGNYAFNSDTENLPAELPGRHNKGYNLWTTLIQTIAHLNIRTVTID